MIMNPHQKGRIAGYASYFNNVDRLHDRVAPGAFQLSLKSAKRQGRMPKMLWQHDPKQPIGVWTRLYEDERGLYAEGRLTLGVGKADEAFLLLKEGAIDGLSIGFRTLKATQDKGFKTRTLLEVDLIEISLVTFGANTLARARIIHHPSSNQ
jgi:hypothetical protein